MATDALTSSAATVTSVAAVLTDPKDGVVTVTPRGWRLRLTSAGLTVSKAPTMGGVQAAPVFPVSLDLARDLASALNQIVT